MNKEEKNEILKHSTAHILAAAVLEMFPEAKFGIGPAIEEGFYYDFELPRTLIPEDLEILEEKMRAIIKEKHSFERKEISIEEALEHFTKLNQTYKIELINDLQSAGETSVSIYKSGHFTDLCKGPHLDSAAEINFQAFKLTKISGAYWKANEKNIQMQRVYGVIFSDKKELKEYLKQQEEAKLRDHRKIGKELDLFSFHDVAPGMPFFHPRGSIIYNELKNFWLETQKEFEYETILCPSMLDVSIWKKSGHWDHYKDDMYFVSAGEDNKQFALRPMDCPGAILIYNNSLRSYRDLPLRYAEPGLITRKEKSGQLGGLLRVQQFTQDDAHIFIGEDQIEEEIKKVIQLVDKIYKPFGLEYKAYLSTRPDDSMGEISTWEKAETSLKKILEELYGENYGLKEKDGAFYGPKIDFQLKDAIGRTWQCATIQLDFQMPLNFNCKYIDRDGKEKTPVLIHRTIMGSFERFMGILIEHYAGNFPTWLSPVQVAIVPVSEKFNDYALEIKNKLIKKGIRASLNLKDESLGKRIREEEKLKVPHVLIIGEKEEADKTVTVRSRGIKEQKTLEVEEFVREIAKEVSEKK
ncbi:MAG: Threonine-tRNA ligase [Candidatus Moranbacteria bacterium GW2011_GWE1_35_17]|nr:MAG: Threonine-tRNA ligase [Candidatus Moranbacteria bacterium GW2011_GWE1_35_17]KKP84406.1 MAG: Threonine-tRNA ligase [Candidatus Moranbacteria bacterium GW2011_GWF1_35_5]